MKIEKWVKFEKPGEKEKLSTIIKSSEDRLDAITQITEEFEVDLVDAASVYDIFKERMNHD